MTFVDAAPRARPQDRADQAAWARGFRRHAPRRTADRARRSTLLVEQVKPGVTTEALDELVFDFAMRTTPIPAPLDYRGYRKSICTSINHVVCHGMPDDKPLREGDIVNIDVTLILDGWHGDASRMYLGRRGAAPRAERLVDVTYEALMRGIAAIGPAARPAISAPPSRPMPKAERCSVVRDFCGHGLGRLFHDEPNILHYGKRGEGVLLKPGMFFTIEPMINLGRAAGEGLVRWLDGGDARPLAVGAVRAHGRRHRDRHRGVHLLAGRARPAAMRRRRLTAA